MDDKQAKFMQEIADLKGEVKYIVQTMQQMQRDTKEVMDKFSKKIDEMARYHQEIGGYVKIAADNSTRLNDMDKRIDKIEKWKVAVIAGASVIAFLLAYNMITLQSLI